MYTFTFTQWWSINIITFYILCLFKELDVWEDMLIRDSCINGMCIIFVLSCLLMDLNNCLVAVSFQPINFLYHFLKITSLSKSSVSISPLFLHRPFWVDSFSLEVWRGLPHDLRSLLLRTWDEVFISWLLMCLWWKGRHVGRCSKSSKSAATREAEQPAHTVYCRVARTLSLISPHGTAGEVTEHLVKLMNSHCSYLKLSNCWSINSSQSVIYLGSVSKAWEWLLSHIYFSQLLGWFLGESICQPSLWSMTSFT